MLDRIIRSLFRGPTSGGVPSASSTREVPEPLTRSAAQSITDASGRSYFDTAGDRIRDAAKWILASFAAIGATLVVGVQLSDIGTLTGARLFGAVSALILGFLGVVVAVRAVSCLLLPTYWTMTELLGASGRRIVSTLERSPELMHPYSRVAEINKALPLAWHEFVVARRAWRIAPTVENGRKLAEAREDFDEVAASGQRTLLWARHISLELEYARLIGRRVIPALVLSFVGVVLFAFLLKQSSSSLPTPGLRGADLSHAVLGQAQLRGVDLTAATLAGATLDNADLSEANLAGANLRGASLRGANLSGASLVNADLAGVIWGGTTCPDGTTSDDAGGTCAAHLQPNHP